MTMPATSNSGTTLSLLLVIAFMLALAPPLHAQLPRLDDAGGGTRYILAFPDTIGNLLDPRYPNTSVPVRFDICIYSGVGGNPVRVTRGDGSRSTLLPAPGRFLVVPVSPDPAVTRVGGVSTNTIAVESLYPVVIYCIAVTPQGMEAWTPLPVDRWGMTYTVAALAGGWVTDIGTSIALGTPPSRRAAPGEIVVIGAYDNTHVSISTGTGQRLAGGETAMEAMLMAGECLQVQSFVDTTLAFDGDQVDPAGMRVVADRPVGVISGNTRSLVRPNMEGLLMNAYKNVGMEWLAPVDEHGTEFVYMPSWDNHRPGINAPAARAGELVRIYGTTAPRTGITVVPTEIADPGGPVAKDTVKQVDLPATRGALFHTSAPAQAYMHSASIVQLLSRTPCFNRVCEEYAGWAPYMVELVPREQWASFAPYYTPAIPTGMSHYINVVTDTLSAPSVVNEYGEHFPFQWRIPGTDLIWGTMMLSAGETHYLLGRDGARFGGFVYGFYKGSESSTPATKARKLEGDELAMGGAVFKEYSALSYAYPLVALRNVLAPPDAYRLTSSTECGRTVVSIHAVGASPTGIRSIALDPALSSNTRIVPIAPASLADVNGMAGVELALLPVDPLADAKGRLVVRDRTGGVWSVDYVHQAAKLAVSTDSLDLGECSVNLPADTVVTITNPIDADVTVNAVTLGATSSRFTITGTFPEGPAATVPHPVTLRRGDSLVVRLRLNTPVAGEHRASLAVAFGCAGESLTLPLRASVVEPLITVPDLSFDTLYAGSVAKTLELNICNVGRGHIGFGPPVSDSVLDLQGEGFTVAPAEIERLKGASIGPGECFALHVTFTPVRPGVFTARARFIGNVRSLRDTSIWSAVVDSASLGVEEIGRGYRLGAPLPNPAGGRVTIGYALGHAGRTVITIHDNAGRSVATLLDGMMAQGEHDVEWDASGVASGIYYCRITSGGWSGSAAVVVAR